MQMYTHPHMHYGRHLASHPFKGPSEEIEKSRDRAETDTDMKFVYSNKQYAEKVFVYVNPPNSLVRLDTPFSCEYVRKISIFNTSNQDILAPKILASSQLQQQ